MFDASTHHEIPDSGSSQPQFKKPKKNLTVHPTMNRPGSGRHL